MEATDFGFDEYIMPPNKFGCFDAQLYPSGFNYYSGNEIAFDSVSYVPQTPAAMMMSTPALGSFDLQPSSPDSMYSRLSPEHSPSLTSPATGSMSPSSNHSSSHSTAPSVAAAAVAAHSITEKIEKANRLPESFLPEFHQYSKETYENGSQGKKRKRQQRDEDSAGSSSSPSSSSSSDPEDEDGMSAAEMRRQIHIQSEQKRRAQIKDGFDELRQHLPGCANKKMSKASLLHRTVQHMQHLKNNQASLMAELERLINENEQLKKFQESVLQKQALERMYHMGAM
ncbi:hypothetical protein DFQ28_006745 [Apophysomyces sp. BC1034]|nr:hypothetical protein DFQ30_002137 [Apophysomyces sp. BC1015]KAG0176867.1 hypothetical protein DFQ29_005539 [Apophysomyces sp. BC1021]KAG0187176.1 hypothetical protein DFQ28_006745 [Apophysomyces sp. BC1034]